jgi:hypothetical protein
MNNSAERAFPKGVYSPRHPTGWPFLNRKEWRGITDQWRQSHVRHPVPAGRPDLLPLVSQLYRDGVAILPAVANAGMISTGKVDLDGFVERIAELSGVKRIKMSTAGTPLEYPVHEFQERMNIYRSHDPLVFSPAYARFLLMPEVRFVAEAYLGPVWFYQAMIATRTGASESRGEGFEGWHHDARGRKLNVFLLLTDVTENGSYTEVIGQSHRLLYSQERLSKNFFTPAESEAVRSRFGWTSRCCHAPAGSLIFFDSHALHRGRRSPELRDAFQVNIMSQSEHSWPHEISSPIRDGLEPAERLFLDQHARLTHRG